MWLFVGFNMLSVIARSRIQALIFFELGKRIKWLPLNASSHVAVGIVFHILLFLFQWQVAVIKGNIKDSVLVSLSRFLSQAN